MNFDDENKLKFLMKRLMEDARQIEIMLQEREVKDASIAALNSITIGMHRLAMSHKDSVTIQEASDRSGVPGKTLYRYVNNGRLKAKQVSENEIIILKDDFIDFLISLPDKKIKK